MKDKIISLAITAMLMLAGWNLHETYIMSKQIVHEARESKSGKLSIAASSGPGERLLPKILGLFKKSYPDFWQDFSINSLCFLHVIIWARNGIWKCMSKQAEKLE